MKKCSAKRKRDSSASMKPLRQAMLVLRCLIECRMQQRQQRRIQKL